MRIKTEIYFRDLGDLELTATVENMAEDFENICLMGEAQSGAKYPVSFDALSLQHKEEVFESLNEALAKYISELEDPRI